MAQQHFALGRFLVGFSMVWALAAIGVAAQIDLRLDVNYTGGSAAAGGTWRLFAETDEQGLFSLSVRLADIATADNALPRGTVNGSDPAGFSIFFDNELSGGVMELFATQQVLDQSSFQQGLFYGVGTLVNGSPNFPGAQPGTNSLGPNITSLTGLQDTPWATEDPLWDNGVTVARGAFSPGDTPSFAASANGPSGLVFTSIGDNSFPGVTTDAVSFTTQVVTNLSFGVTDGDYNGNGVVDAADYTLWRDSRGSSVPAFTGADGNGDGQINQPDYNLWASNFGATAGGAVSAAVSVPEAGSCVLALAACFTQIYRVRRGL